MDETKSKPMQGGDSVETWFLTEAPPYWKEAQVKQEFTGLDLAEVAVKKMRWPVRTLRTSTWKVQAQTVKDLVGKVLTSTTGKRKVTIITEAQYQFWRSLEYTPSQVARPAERERD